MILKNLWYMARRFKTATVLNFTGLVVAFAACYLFLTQVTYNHSYNRGLTDYEQLYRVELPAMMDHSKWQSQVSRFLADQLDSLPQVQSMALVQCWYSDWRFVKGNTEFKFGGCNVSNNALTTLAPRRLDGKIGWTDGDQRGIVIPASVAKAYFGTTQAAGRSMWSGKDSMLVRGVFEDFPENCVMKNCIYGNMGDENRGNFQNYNYNCYLRLRQPLDTVQIRQTIFEPLVEQIHQIYLEHGMEDQWDETHARSGFGMRLTPITETWFSSIDPEQDRGNKTVDLILQLSCLLVIIIAAINFLNFTLAESPMRIKSINTRRVLGSSVTSLRLGFVAETVTTSLAAFVVALGVSYLLSRWPLMGELTVGSIALSKHGLLIAALAVAAVVVGVVAGLYPAFYVTSFQPALALKGSFGLSPKGRRLRTALLCLQFVITSIMVVYIGILYLQSHYIYTSDYGFAKDEVLYTRLENLRGQREALRTEVLTLTGVEEVAFSQICIDTQDSYMTWGRKDDDHEIHTNVLRVDWRYLRTLGIKVVEGRDFTEHDGLTATGEAEVGRFDTDEVYIINEAARRQWDWVEMDKPLLNNHMGRVVGVCENVRFATTRVDRETAPMMFMVRLDPREEQSGWNPMQVMNVRVSAGIDKVAMRTKIAEKMKTMGYDGEPDVRFLDQELENTYREDFRFIHQVLLFSVVCLVITLIGVFCLTLFETEYRRKEIGIRKVFGSTEEAILLLLSRRYVLIILVSFLLAAPLAWYFGTQWLQSFAERTLIHWWLFPLALLAVSAITLATVGIQGWRAATENPVNSIKTE